MRIFELPLDSHDSNESPTQLYSYVNSVWCIVITMTTVGYGDISPKTMFGRIVAMTTALWGAFIISIVVYCTTKIFVLTNNQEMAVNQIAVSKKAARTIQKSFRFFKAKIDYLKFMKQWEKKKGYEHPNNAYPLTYQMLQKRKCMHEDEVKKGACHLIHHSDDYVTEINH